MNYVSRRPPRVKQREALEKMKGQPAFALLMAMRTGKTKPIIDEWGQSILDDGFLDLLVIAPAGAYRPWEGEVRKELPDGILERVMVFVWESGRSRGKAQQRVLQAFMEYRGPRLLLVNTEAVSTVQDARGLCKTFGLQRPGRNTIAVDESVTIKNPEAACSLFCVKELSLLFTRRRILTGLVSPQSPLDVYSQFKFLDTRILGFDKYATFKARHAKIRQVCMLPTDEIKRRFKQCLGYQDGFRHLNDETLRRRMEAIFPGVNVGASSRGDMIGYLKNSPDALSRDAMILAINALGGYIQTIAMIDEYLHVDEIHQKIAPYSFRVRLEDCYDMPPSDYSFRDVEMTKEQERIYSDMKNFATAMLESEVYVTAHHVITQMLRLHQVLCGHTRDEQKNWHSIPEKRTKSLVDLLSDYDGKAVIWCSYDHDVGKVTAALEKEFGSGSTSRFWGGNINTREEEEVVFKTDPRRRFMVGTPDAGRYGRDWSVADLVVYYSQRNNLDHRSQSEERVKADGKMRPVAYVDLRVPGTVEDGIIAALRDKIEMADVINGDNWRKWLI